MLEGISFGQYYSAKSFVHKMDARIKILLLIAYLVTVFVVKNFYGFLALAGFLILAIAFSPSVCTYHYTTAQPLSENRIFRKVRPTISSALFLQTLFRIVRIPTAYNQLRFL